MPNGSFDNFDRRGCDHQPHTGGGATAAGPNTTMVALGGGALLAAAASGFVAVRRFRTEA